MFYIDPTRNFTIFSAGKQGTTFLKHAINDYLEKNQINHTQSFLSSLPEFSKRKRIFNEKVPVYDLSNETFNSYTNLYKDNKYYIIIKEPIERFTSGLVENIWCMMQVRKLPNKEISKELVTKNFNIISTFNNYHCGRYLTEIQHSLELCNIVDSKNLTDFTQQLFDYNGNNIPNNKLEFKNIVLTESFRDELTTRFNVEKVDSELLKQYLKEDMKILCSNRFVLNLEEEEKLYEKYKNEENAY